MPREFYENIIINDTSPCSSITSGSLQVKGGIGCSENIFLNGCISMNKVCISTPIDSEIYDFILPKNEGVSGEILCSSGKRGLKWVKATGSGNIVLSNNASFGGFTTLGKTNISIGSTSNDIYTGALTVVGGISTQENLNVGGYVGISGLNGSITKIKSSSNSVYNFILPQSPGTKGQVLTSGGGVDNPMNWTCMKTLFSNPTSIGDVTPIDAFLTKLSIGNKYKEFPLSISSNENGIASFFNGVTRVGSITTDGNSTMYNTTSDYRLKENVKNYNMGIDKIKSLRPVSFNYIDNLKNVVGFIAHELQDVIPEAVSGNKDEYFPNGCIKPQMIEYSRLTPYIVSCLQEIIKELSNINQKFQS